MIIIFIDKDTLKIDNPNVVVVYKDELIIVTEATHHHHVHIYSKSFRKCSSFNLKTKEVENPRPRGVATNGEHIFIAERSTGRIMKYTKNGIFVCQSEESFEGSCGITIYEGELYVAHQLANKVQVLDYNLKNSSKKKCFDNLKLSKPRDVAVANDGTIYVSAHGNDCIKVFRHDEEIIKDFSNELNTCDFRDPQGICIYKNENIEYVLVAAAGKKGSCVFVFKSDGSFVTSIGNEKIGRVNAKIYGIDVDSDGNVYAADYGGYVIKFKLENYLPSR